MNKKLIVYLRDLESISRTIRKHGEEETLLILHDDGHISIDGQSIGFPK